jgi:phage terminase Nu1 subunit (DNA packaging protein)
MPKSIKEMEGICTARTLATLLNLTQQHVANLAQDGIIPKIGHGQYDVIPAVQAYVRYLQGLAKGRRMETEEVHAERARLVRAQAARAELEVEQRKGLLLPVIDVLHSWEQLVDAFRARLLSLPMRLAPRLVAMNESRTIQTALTASVREALQELSRFDLASCTAANDTPSRPGGKAAAGANGKSMGGRKPAAQPRGQRRARTIPIH